MGRLWVWCFCAALATAANAFEPRSLPETAEQTYEFTEDPGSVSFPVGVYKDGLPTVVLEGRIHWQAWRVPSANLSTLRLVRGLREDLDAAGYEVLLDCSTDDCGGFDFRYALPVLPAPEMNVDLFDFRVITARLGSGDEAEHVLLLVSRGRVNRFVQAIDVTGGVEARNRGEAVAPEAPPPEAVPVEQPEPPADVSDPLDGLRREGHVVLSDLDFPTGTVALADRNYASLEALAGFLKENPARRIALVGHTDAVGSLEANTALSRRRAEAVRQRLIQRHGVAGSQVSAQGAGYLAPVASNLTAEGREANRRVEAVLLAAE